MEADECSGSFPHWNVNGAGAVSLMTHNDICNPPSVVLRTCSNGMRMPLSINSYNGINMIACDCIDDSEFSMRKTKKRYSSESVRRVGPS